MPGTAEGWARLINSEWRRLHVLLYKNFFSHTAARKTDVPFLFRAALFRSFVAILQQSSFLLFGAILETFQLAFCPPASLAKCQAPKNSNVQDTANLLWISSMVPRENFWRTVWAAHDPRVGSGSGNRSQLSVLPGCLKGTKGGIARRLLINNWANEKPFMVWWQPLSPQKNGPEKIYIFISPWWPTLNY